MNRKGSVYVLLAGISWGMMGLFVITLYDSGLETLQIVSLRSVSAALIMLGYVGFKDPKILRISLSDLPVFVMVSLFSVVFFSYCFFSTIQETSLSIAVTLLYTAPTFVTILSRIFFKEWLTPQKIIALLTTFLGLTLVTGFLGGEGTITVRGLATGLGSGLGYGLFSILGKVILRKYKPLTLATYTFVIAAVILLPTLAFALPGPGPMGFGFYRDVFLLGLVPTAIAYIFYAKGLETMESSLASITATVEPVVGALIGVLVFKEVLSSSQVTGMLLVLLSVIILQVDDNLLKNTHKKIT